MTLEMTKEEIKAELHHWTVYNMIEGALEIENAFDQALKYLIEALEVEIDKDEYFDTPFIKEVFDEVEKFNEEW